MQNETDPIFDPSQFQTVIGRILIQYWGGDGVVTDLDSRAGTFNRVVNFTYAGRKLGVRLTLGTRNFRYERDIIKEVFAVSLLNFSGQRMDDEKVADLVQALLATPKGSHLAHESMRTIFYYDWSMTELPYPFFLFEWIEGAVLWEQPYPEHYHRAGLLLAGLHRVRFEHFYENIFSIHHVPRSWRDHLRVCLNRELSRAAFNLPDKLITRLNALDMSSLQAGAPCLVHNDFSGANIVLDEGGQAHAIDWDNWVVDCPELDLVKMKYWTAIGRESKLTHRHGLYDAFLQGYRAVADHQIDDRRLQAYEHLWLLRCFNFESSLEAGGQNVTVANSWRHVYPGAEYYLDLLRDL